MLRDALISRIPRLPRLFRPVRPRIAVELTEDFVAVARGGRGGGVSAWFHAPLPPGALRSSPVQQNLVDAKAVAPLLAEACQRVAPGGGPTALCLPDVVTRIAVIQAESLPRRHEELRELVAWRVKKSLPFPIDEAELAWEVFPPGPGGQRRLLAAVIRRRVLEEYESLLADAELSVGAVTTSSLVLAQALPEQPDGDALLLNVHCGWFSALVTDGHEPLFYRCKPLPVAERSGSLRAAFIGGELSPTIEYYRKRVAGRGLASLHLHVVGPGREDLDHELSLLPDAADLLPPQEVPSRVPREVPGELRSALAAASHLVADERRQELRPPADALGGAALKVQLNLASRPLVNRTPLVALVGTLAVAAVGLTAWNAALWLDTRAEAQAVESQLAALENEERALEEHRGALRRRLEAVELRALDRRVASTNAVLSEKAVNWTLLLERLQELTPWQVRLESIRTNVQDQDVSLSLDLRTQQADYYWEFIERLETHDCFSNVYPASQGEMVDGELEVTLQLEHNPWCGQEDAGLASERERRRRARGAAGGRSRG